MAALLSLTRSLIAHILSMRHPTAIVRFVIAVVVPPIKFLAGRAFAHIRKEVRKRSPFGTDGNSSPSIISELLMLPVKAAIRHFRPTIVSGCPPHAVLDHALAASTRFGAATTKAIEKGDSFIATSTLEIKLSLASALWCFCYDCQLSERLPRRNYQGNRHLSSAPTHAVGV